MKKIVLFAATCLTLGLWSNLNAQTCEDIVRPYLIAGNIDPEIYPEGKLDWQCRYSRNAFYLTDKLPSYAEEHDITELTDVVTNQHPDKDFVVDLEYLSYWQYDFLQFQLRDYHRTIYFRLHGTNKKKYLALRTVDEMYERTAFPDHFKDLTPSKQENK